MSYQHPSWGEDREDDRRVIAHCSYCGREIHAGNDEYYGDDAYTYDGTWACEYCTTEFLEIFKVKGD